VGQDGAFVLQHRITICFLTRNRSVDELTTEWREGRDKLVLDYKRKRKDVSFVHVSCIVLLFLCVNCLVCFVMCCVSEHPVEHLKHMSVFTLANSALTVKVSLSLSLLRR